MTDNRTLDEELLALKEDLARLQEDVTGLTSRIRENATEQIEGTQSAIREDIRNAREKLKAKIAHARGRGRRAVEEVEETISERPFTSIAAAVGIGFVIAKLMGLGFRR